MYYHAYPYALSLLCFWFSQNLVQATISHAARGPPYPLEETFDCDKTHMEGQLDALNLRMVIMQEQLNKQNELFKSIESKLQIQLMQEKLLQNEAKICSKGENNNLLRTSHAYPTSCADFDGTHCADNKCRISNHLYGPVSFLVACNDREDGGGWTIIQRRINGSVDFYRNWLEYKDGFGNIDGEFFIGLDKLHALTTTLKPMELLIQVEDFNNTMKYAKYDDFQVGNETENYKLIKLGSYTGNARDSLRYHEGFSFSTKDRDNDIDDDRNCAKSFTGGWWYKKCLSSNLNGKYYEAGEVHKAGTGICWGELNGVYYSMKFVQMMIRPKRL